MVARKPVRQLHAAPHHPPIWNARSGMRRGDASEQVERELRIDHGGAVELDLYFGTISPNGNIVWHPEPLTEFYDVEPAFDPPKVPSPDSQQLLNFRVNFSTREPSVSSKLWNA